MSFFLLLFWVLFAHLSVVALAVTLGCSFYVFIVSRGKLVSLLTVLFQLLLLHFISFGSLCFHFHFSLGDFVAYCLAFMYLCFLQLFSCS